MKNLLIILCLICFCISAAAEIPSSYRAKNLPQGTFKKQRNGVIVQYDKNGKKIGKYKLGTGSYTKIK